VNVIKTLIRFAIKCRFFNELFSKMNKVKFIKTDM
jgi:hypothetical protein